MESFIYPLKSGSWNESIVGVTCVLIPLMATIEIWWHQLIKFKKSEGTYKRLSRRQ